MIHRFGILFWLTVFGLALAGRVGVLRAEGPNSGADWLGSIAFGSSSEPIQVTADVFEFDYKKRVLTYRGKVQARQGEVSVESDEMTLTLEGDGNVRLREVRARGNVRLRQGERTAQAAEAVFDRKSGTATLTGQVELRDGPNQLRGERLVVYLDENRTVIEGGPRERVRAVLFPPQGTIER